MPIEPIDIPYRVLRFQKVRGTRRVERHDPEEKQQQHEEENLKPPPEESAQPEIPEDSTKTSQKESEKSGKDKPKLDIRI